MIATIDESLNVITVLVLLGVLVSCAAGVETTSEVQQQEDWFQTFPYESTVAILPVTGGDPSAQEALTVSVDSTLRVHS